MTNPSSSDDETTDRRHDRRSAESELFSLEADRSHLVRQQDLAVTTLQTLRQSVRQKEAEILDQEEKMKQLMGKITEIDTEIHQAKKRLRTIH